MTATISGLSLPPVKVFRFQDPYKSALQKIHQAGLESKRNLEASQKVIESARTIISRLSQNPLSPLPSIQERGIWRKSFSSDFAYRMFLEQEFKKNPSKALVELVLDLNDEGITNIHSLLYTSEPDSNRRKIVREFLLNCSLEKLQKFLRADISYGLDNVMATNLLVWIGDVIGERVDSQALADLIQTRLEKEDFDTTSQKRKTEDSLGYLLLGIVEKKRQYQTISYLRFLVENRHLNSAFWAVPALAKHPGQENYLWQRIIDPNSNPKDIVPHYAMKNDPMTVSKLIEFLKVNRADKAACLKELFGVDNCKEAFAELLKDSSVDKAIRQSALKTFVRIGIKEFSGDYMAIAAEFLSKTIDFESIFRDIKDQEISSSLKITYINSFISKVGLNTVIEWATTADNETLRKNASYILTNLETNLVKLIGSDQEANNKYVRLLEAALAA